jgi:hypothetical protein
MGSLFSSPKPPKPLNVAKVSAEQQKANTNNAFQQEAFNRLNQTDQYGNQLKYKQSGTDGRGNPIYSVNQSLGQTGQQFAGGLGSLGMEYFQGAQNLLGNPADYTNAGTEARIDELGRRRLDPRHTQLVNRGLDPTSEAYKAQMDQFGQTKNDAYNQLALQGRGQAFDEALRGRSAQIEELQGLTAPGLKYGMGAVNPNLVNTPGVNVGHVDLTSLYGMQQAQKNANYQAQVQNQNGMLGGLASIGGSLAMAPMTGGGSLFGNAVGGLFS